MLANDGRARCEDDRAEPTVTWVGHATLLIQLDGVNVLTDPQWSERASPVSLAGPERLTPPGLRFEDLPPIHVVLISHDHYDHLDVATVSRLAATHRPRFFVPLGLSAWFADLGITDVDELDWWDARRVRGLTLTCVPVQHFSGRTLWDRDRRLWSGWAVAGGDRRLSFRGRHRLLDAHAPDRRAPRARSTWRRSPIGAYVPPAIMRPAHTTPEEALQIFADVRGRGFVADPLGHVRPRRGAARASRPCACAAEAERLGLDPDAHLDLQARRDARLVAPRSGH